VTKTIGIVATAQPERAVVEESRLDRFRHAIETRI
jgi:hypothetical protein